MTDKDVEKLIDTVTTAVGRSVAEIFNVTPPPLRPVAMAALRASTEAAVAAMDPVSRALYNATLSRLETVAIKTPKGGGGHEDV